MTGAVPRERRQRVRIDARMRVDSACMDVTIRNVSSHGLLLSAPAAPRRGSYVEVMRPGVTTAARVVWTDGESFGVRTRERIDVARIASEVPATPAPEARPGRKTYVHGLHHVEHSEADARRMQFVAVAAGVALAAMIGAYMVYRALLGMSDAVIAGMG